MINFFRKTRKKMADDNKPIKYLRYAIGEIVLVMIGILLALQVNNWNEERKDSLEELLLIENLHSEFISNQHLLDEIIPKKLMMVNLNRNLSNVLNPNAITISEDSLNEYMGGLGYLLRYVPDKSVIGSVMSSGKLSLIQNDNLNYKLGAWLGQLDKYNYWSGVNNKFVQESIYPFVDDYYQLKNLQIGIILGKNGKSTFEKNQLELLVNAKFENLVERKRILSEQLYRESLLLSKLQLEIIELMLIELEKK